MFASVNLNFNSSLIQFQLNWGWVSLNPIFSGHPPSHPATHLKKVVSQKVRLKTFSRLDQSYCKTISRRAKSLLWPFKEYSKTNKDSFNVKSTSKMTKNRLRQDLIMNTSRLIQDASRLLFTLTKLSDHQNKIFHDYFKST